MATVNKDFRVKHGLVVEGGEVRLDGSTSGQTLLKPSATASGTLTLPAATGTLALTSDIPTTENIEDIIGGMVSGNTETGIAVTYDDETGKLNFAVDASIDTEGVQDIVGNMVTGNTENGISVTYDDDAGKLNFDVNDPTITLSGDVTGSATMTNLGNVTITATIAADSVALGVDTTGDYVATIGGTDGVSVSGTGTESRAVTIANTDKGSSQNIFKNVVVGATTITANSNNDTLNFTTGSGISLTGNASTDTVEISNTGILAINGTADQIAVSTATGTATISLPNAVTFPGTVTLNADPTQALHAATKQYVDAATTGLNVHDSVQVATTTNIDLSTALENGDLLDGITLATGMRVLVKNQSTKTQNGVYVVQASGAAVRAADYNEAGEVDAGDFIFVESGTINGKTGWVQTNKITTLGSDDIEFTQFSGAGTYLAGNGLTLTGEVFSINTAVTADLTTAQTLSNKTLTSPVLTNPSVNGLYITDNNITIEGTDDIYETTLTFNDPTQDRTITVPDASGTIALLGSIALGTDTTGNYVATIAGTTDQITVTGSGSETAAVTLSLPQNIATTSSPTFAGVSVGSGSVTAGSVTLTDALIGTATQVLTTGDATVIDSWAVASYSSAKYIVQMKKNNDIEVIEVLVTVDGNNNVYLTEYADVISNVQLGTTDADFLSGNVRLLVTASNGTTVKVHKTLIEA